MRIEATDRLFRERYFGREPTSNDKYEVTQLWLMGIIAAGFGYNFDPTKMDLCFLKETDVDRLIDYLCTNNSQFDGLCAAIVGGTTDRKFQYWIKQIHKNYEKQLAEEDTTSRRYREFIKKNREPTRYQGDTNVDVSMGNGASGESLGDQYSSLDNAPRGRDKGKLWGLFGGGR